MKELNAHALKAGFAQYSAPREPGEMDVVVEVRRILSEALAQAGRPLVGFDEDSIIIDAANKTANVQRWLLNRYWVRQFALCSANSMDVRRYLINNGTEEEWIALFKQFVAPFVVANGLPTVQYAAVGPGPATLP